MATQWYWLEQNQEKGPVSFQELALMVQDHVLNEDDLVRPHYLNDWQTADRVVGLFYMARRVARPRPEEPSVEIPGVPVAACSQGDPPDSWSPSDLPPLEFPSEDSSALVIAAARSGNEIQPAIECSSDVFPATAPEPGGELATAIHDAVEAWDERHPTNAPRQSERRSPFSLLTRFAQPFAYCGSAVMATAGKLLDVVFYVCRLLRVHSLAEALERIASRQVLALWFRGMCAVVVALAVGWGVKAWSDYETLRYPNPDWIAAGRTVFPLFGPCRPGEYMFMLVDVMIASGIIGFFGAAYLEKLAED